MDQPSPFISPVFTVPAEWIDYNGHMNMAYYNMACDRAVDHVFDQFGLGERYRHQTSHTIYTAEFHTRYLRELHEDQPFSVETLIVGHDTRRLHLFQTVRAAESWEAATGEAIQLHVDLSGPKVAPFPRDIQRALDKAAEHHRALEQPPSEVLTMSLSRKRGGTKS